MDYTYDTLENSYDKELWEFLGDYKKKKVQAMEVFYDCFDDQKLEDVKIEIRDPWVIISFDKKDSILATYVLGYKAIWNLAGPDAYKFYLNDKEFSHEELDLITNVKVEKVISSFIINHKNNIKEKNNYKIEIIDNSCLDYLRQIKIFLREKDYTDTIEDFFIEK